MAILLFKGLVLQQECSIYKVLVVPWDMKPVEMTCKLAANNQTVTIGFPLDKEPILSLECTKYFLNITGGHPG